LSFHPQNFQRPLLREAISWLWKNQNAWNKILLGCHMDMRGLNSFRIMNNRVSYYQSLLGGFVQVEGTLFRKAGIYLQIS